MSQQQQQQQQQSLTNTNTINSTNTTTNNTDYQTNFNMSCPVTKLDLPDQSVAYTGNILILKTSYL